MLLSGDMKWEEGAWLTVTDHDKSLKLDDLILELEVSQERARVMASNINQEYFDLREDSYKLYYFNHYGIEFDILFE